MNYSNELSNAEKPYLALKSLKKVIRPLNAATKNEKLRQTFREWITKIDEIDIIQGNGSTNEAKMHNTFARKNSASQELYDYIEDQIWLTLGNMDFFTKDTAYGLGIKDEDFKDAEEQ